MRVLFVWFKKYKGILEGGGIANHRNYTMAQKVLGESNVDSIYVHDENKSRSLWNYLQTLLFMPFGYYNGLTPSFIRDIYERANSYDYIFLNTSLFGIIAKKLKSKGYQGRVIAHFHNVESIYYKSLFSKWNPLRYLFIRCADMNDRYSCLYSDKMIVLNSRDQLLLRKMYGRMAEAVVNITMRDQLDTSGIDMQATTSQRPLCLFVGSCFTANNEGVLWFVRNVLPHVDIDFRIVGKGMSKLKSSCAELRDIPVVSDAPSLQPYYEMADFMIMPIFSGSGMKVKTCEALMYGKNILGSDESFEGYDIDDEKVGGRCNTAQDYIQRLLYYTQHPIPRFNQYSRQLFLQKYSEQQSFKLYQSIFSRA